MTTTAQCTHNMTPEKVASWWAKVPPDATVTICCCCSGPAPLDEYVSPGVGVYCKRCKAMCGAVAA